MSSQNNSTYDLFEPDYNHPENAERIADAAKRHIDRSETTLVTIDGKSVLYVYCRPDDRLLRNHKLMQEVADVIRDRFKTLFPDTEVLVGYYDLKFTQITKKDAFAERLKGTAT